VVKIVEFFIALAPWSRVGVSQFQLPVVLAVCSAGRVRALDTGQPQLRAEQPETHRQASDGHPPPGTYALRLVVLKAKISAELSSTIEWTQCQGDQMSLRKNCPTHLLSKFMHNFNRAKK
jgi:hypothetical protein